MSTLRVALAQINPTVGDLAANAAKVADRAARARQAGADLVTYRTHASPPDPMCPTPPIHPMAPH